MLFVWALSPPATEDPAILCLSLFELFDLKMDIFGGFEWIKVHSGGLEARNKFLLFPFC